MLITMLAAFASAGASTAITYQASSSTIDSNDDSDELVTATLIYDSDGTARKIEDDFLTGPAVVQISRWASETPSAGWYVRVKYVSNSNSYVSGAGLNTWLALTVDRTWNWSKTDTGESTVTGTFSVEISDDGGSTIYDGPNNFDVVLFNRSP